MSNRRQGTGVAMSRVISDHHPPIASPLVATTIAVIHGIVSIGWAVNISAS